MEATLSDGTRVSGMAEFVEASVAADELRESMEAEWVIRLRAQGVRAAHPDDGWVERRCNRVHLAYPQFNDGLEVGDLLALGRAADPTRLVRITGTSGNQFAIGPDRDHWYFHFETT